jgi:DNA-binding transcriptional ArsR family regulator
VVEFAGPKADYQLGDAGKATSPPCQVEAFPCESQACKSCEKKCPCSLCDNDRIKGLFITSRDPVQVQEEWGLKVTPGFQITPDTNTGAILSAVREFTQRSSPTVILFEFDTLGPELEDMVRRLKDEMKEDGILMVTTDSWEELAPLKEEFTRDLQETMISTLANPIMRDILGFVNKREGASFTSILEELDMDSPSRLSYHMGKLKSARMLLQDRNSLYRLTGLGRMTIETLTRMESEYIEDITL